MTQNTACPALAPAPAAGESDRVNRPSIAALEQQLATLFATARAMMRDRALAVHPELSPGSYSVLSLLVRTGPHHARALASQLYLDKSVISRIVKQLTDLGLVERRPDPTDGRAFYIAATPEAVERVQAVVGRHRSAMYTFLDSWDEGEVTVLTDLLARLNTATAQAGTTHPTEV